VIANVQASGVTILNDVVLNQVLAQFGDDAVVDQFELECRPL
jgi:hypothetical protein